MTRFRDLQRLDAYQRKKWKLTESASAVGSLVKRLVYNDSQRRHYMHVMSQESSHRLSQVVEGSAKWEKKKTENMKIVKRNPFTQVEDLDAKISMARGGPQKANQNALAVFFTDDERRNHIKVYKLAWYPPSEPSIKNIEALEGSTGTLIDKKAYILGGFANSANRCFFEYDVATDAFQALETKGIAPKCILYHTAVAIDKNLYLFGGDSGMAVANSKVVSNELWKLNVTSLEWTKIRPLKNLEARKHHAACEFGDFMLVSGGISEETNIPFNDFHAYDPEKEEWFKIHDQVEWAGLSHHTMTPVYTSKVKSLYSKSTTNAKNKIDANDVSSSLLS